MDSGFLGTLIYIIIIVIFLSSLLKKKPKGTEKKPIPPEYRRRENDSVRSGDNVLILKKENGNKEIQDEIENLFKKENKPPVPPVKEETATGSKSRDSSTAEKREIPDEYSKWPGSGVPSQQIESVLGKVEKDILYVDTKIEQEALLFEKLLNEKEDINNYAILIKEKFKDPKLLKEYFVISEIIGKPKALRR